MFSRNRLSAVAVFLAIFFSAPAFAAGSTAAPAVAAAPAIVAAQSVSGSAAAQAAEHLSLIHI